MENLKSLAFLEQVSSLKLKPIGMLEAAKSVDIIDYVEELDKSQQWEKIKDGGNFEVKRLTSSKYNDEFPVEFTQYSMHRQIPFEILAKVLYQPNERMTWDTKIKAYEIIEGNSLGSCVSYHVVEDYQIYRGDFIERRVIGIHNNQFVVVSYSIENSARPVVPDSCRGTNFFTVFFFSDRLNTTELKIYSQVDLNSKAARDEFKREQARFLHWIENLEKVAISEL